MALAILVGQLAPVIAQGQTGSIRLAKIIYLTPNLDSLARHFAKMGLTANSEFEHPFGLSKRTIILASGQHIELESSGAPDSSDWRKRAISRYGSHLSGISFSVNDLALLKEQFQHAGIADSAMDSVVALATPKPLDVTFVQDGAAGPTPMPVDTASHPVLSRITWLVLTASANEEEQLRRIFDVLRLHKQHEGCCDYWLIGPAETRVGIRFELPDAKLARGRSALDQDWLSIEEGGLIFNY